MAGQNKRRWKDWEDAHLRKAVKKAKKFAKRNTFRMNWTEVALDCPGRNPKQCRNRWKHIVCGSNGSRWSRDEDGKLLDLFNSFGPRWTKIQRSLPNRTDNAIKARFRLLKQDTPPKYDEIPHGNTDTSSETADNSISEQLLPEVPKNLEPLDSSGGPPTKGPDLEELAFWFPSTT